MYIPFTQLVVNPQLEDLILPRRFSCWPVLIHVNGVTESVIDQGYFTEIIDFSEFLEE